MNPQSILYLNVETQRNATDVGGWFPEKMGVSAAVALSGHTLRIFTEKDISELACLLQKARCVVGYNITGLDFKVLEGCLGVDLQRVRSLDLAYDIEAAAGRRVVLHSLQKATLGTTSRHDSLESVQLWKEGRVSEVIEGACNRVLAIKALHEIGCQEGRLFYYPRVGGRRKRIAVQWFPLLSRARCKKRPTQSPVSNPVYSNEP